MKLEYSLHEQDYLTHQLFTASTNKRIQAKRKRGRFIVPAVYIVIGVLFYEPEKIGFTAMIAVLAILWLLFYPLYDSKRYIKHFQNFIRDNHQESMGKQSRIEFQEKSILATSEESESKISHQEIQALFELPHHFLVRLKGAQSFILPKNQVDEAAVRTELETLGQKLNLPLEDHRNWHWK